MFPGLEETGIRHLYHQYWSVSVVMLAWRDTTVSNSACILY